MKKIKLERNILFVLMVMVFYESSKFSGYSIEIISKLERQTYSIILIDH